jgi:uncharacterized protein YggU (UPF0235/DUF167 family)
VALRPRPASNGMYIRVKVFAGVKKELFKEIGENRFEIHVKEPAERNLANSRVIALVAEHFGVSFKSVRIVNGHHHPVKLLAVEISKS